MHHINYIQKLNTNNMYRKIFFESVNQLGITKIQYEAINKLVGVLFEDAASTATHKTKRVIREVLPDFGSMFDEIATDDNGAPILTSTGKTQTVIEYLERNVKTTYFHDGKSNIKFEPGVARIAYGELGMQQNEDTRKLRILGRILQEISSAHASEYDFNLNGMSYYELNERFGGTVKQADDNERQSLKTKEYSRSNYVIKWIPDFETAKQYSEYTNFGPNEHWCLTHMQDMWNSYTGNHNENKVYFCHVPNFEHVPRQVGDNIPLDEYGLSLISVIVTPENELRAVTCRWNHTNGGSDGVMDAKQLSDLLGGYVFDLCPPYSKEEVKERGYIPFEDVQQMLDDGVDLSKFIDEDGIIELNNKYNVIRDGKLISNKWFEACGEFRDGYAPIGLNNKGNYIDDNGNFLSDQWFDFCGSFIEGYGVVELNGKWNYIDANGNLLSDQWFDFDWCGNFDNGYANVKLNGQWNCIDTNGNLLFDQWFDSIGSFHNGFTLVKLNGRVNFINADCQFLSDQWFDYPEYFPNGLGLIKLNGKFNFINTNGKLLSDQWFDYADEFHNGHTSVKLNGDFFRIDTHGNRVD